MAVAVRVIRLPCIDVHGMYTLLYHSCLFKREKLFFFFVPESDFSGKTVGMAFAYSAAGDNRRKDDKGGKK